MKYNQLKAELISAGCFLVRQGANHEMWYSPITGKYFPFPRHGGKEIPMPTEKAIRKQSGVL
jgi:hypothetical protein